MNNTYSLAESSCIEIAADAAVSVQVAIGTTIQCLRGRVWLTQEGDSRDYALPGGTSFSVDRPGQAVLTSVEGESVVVVRKSGLVRVPGTLSIDSIESLTRAARQAQAAYVGRAFARLFAWPLSQMLRLRSLPGRKSPLEGPCIQTSCSSLAHKPRRS
jgi:hypothetical protein